MGRNRIGLQFDGWQEYIGKLDQLGGTAAMKTGTEKALVESKKHVNPKIEEAVAKSNLPRKGKYSRGATVKSINNSDEITWNGMTAEIKVGFDFKKSGLTSIFLMYGTPRMKPVKGLKSAIYGTKTQKEIAEIQEAEVMKVIKIIMEGK